MTKFKLGDRVRVYDLECTPGYKGTVVCLYDSDDFDSRDIGVKPDDRRVGVIRVTPVVCRKLKPVRHRSIVYIMSGADILYNRGPGWRIPSEIFRTTPKKGFVEYREVIKKK